VSPILKYVSWSHVKQFWSIFGSHFKHISRTKILCHPVLKYMFQLHVKQFWSMFGSHYKHISRTNMLCSVTQSQIHVPITCKAILEHVWITFQAHFTKNILCHLVSKFMSLLHVKQFWSTFASRFKHVTRINIMCHPVSNTCPNHM
jgi:hypothetical protein